MEIIARNISLKFNLNWFRNIVLFIDKRTNPIVISIIKRTN